MGGFYIWYNTTIFTESVHKLYENIKVFSYIFDKRIDDLKNMKQKNVQLYVDLYKNVAFHVIMSTDVSKKIER